MRKIDSIILHCSATHEGQDVKVATIKQWHVQSNGWSDIGYHYVVELDGKVRLGRDIARAGAHTNGHNATSIGICYVGGLEKNSETPKDTRTDAQKENLLWLVKQLCNMYRLTIANVHVHNEYAKKACPSFSRDTFVKEYTSKFGV